VTQLSRQGELDNSYATLIIDVRKLFMRRGNKAYVEINTRSEGSKTVAC
jgi:hypothetical protein